MAQFECNLQLQGDWWLVAARKTLHPLLWIGSTYTSSLSFQLLQLKREKYVESVHSIGSFSIRGVFLIIKGYVD